MKLVLAAVVATCLLGVINSMPRLEAVPSAEAYPHPEPEPSYSIFSRGGIVFATKPTSLLQGLSSSNPRPKAEASPEPSPQGLSGLVDSVLDILKPLLCGIADLLGSVITGVLYLLSGIAHGILSP
ncbi:hypothetical protein J6590_015053 [Homalodisca vitripennis]|nr:hypothetical protein J6590_015053 [Homalodisca vitripennis]